MSVDSLLLSIADELDKPFASPVTRPYMPSARTKQLPPDHPRHHLPDDRGFVCGCTEVDDDWTIWLIQAGRGFGKTAVGANWIVHQALTHPDSEWAIFAPTFRDVRKTCIEGSSGVLRALREDELTQYRRNESQIVLSNGASIFGYSAEEPDRARGSNLWGAWCDELASWSYPETWHEGLVPALRLGEHPRIVVTTTPRPTELIRNLVGRNDGTVHITRGSTFENADNLSTIALAELQRRYGGTRLGRQELEGELLDDVDGALWKRADIDNTRIGKNDVPHLAKIVVAIDPAVTSAEGSDETGIIVAGEAGAHGYVLADYSMRGTPHACMVAVAKAYREFEADVVVGEVNNGGDYIGTLLRTVAPSIPYRMVRASRGKMIRAQPIASLYEQRKVHHVGAFPELEDQLVNWLPDSGESPDRLDALVWAISELRGLFAGPWAEAYGVIVCEKCKAPFLISSNPTHCPKCRHPHEGMPSSGAAA